MVFHMIDLGGDTPSIILAAPASAKRDPPRAMTEVKGGPAQARPAFRRLGAVGFTVGTAGRCPAQQGAISRTKVLLAHGLTLWAIRDDLAKRGHKVSHVLAAKLVAGHYRRMQPQVG